MKTINTAPNSPFKGYLPNVNPFGVSPRYTNSVMLDAYKRASEDSVTSTVKPIDRDKANLEAEKNEVLLTFKPTGLALHKIQGKPHSKGGTPLNVPEGSFIFSKDKSMALTKDEIEEYKLGTFQKGGLVNNSPAKVLGRNVDLKHNNKMVDNLQNSKNFAEKNTARLMLEKYQKTISTIAALQEIRKPDAEIPEFAQLIPQNPIIETLKDQQKQYSKGGWVSLPKAQLGITYRIVNGIRVPIDPDKPSINEIPLKMQNLKQEESFSPQMQDAIVENTPPNPYGTIRQGQEEWNTPPQELDMTDDMSWIKPYNWTPKHLSMMGNLMQSPRSLYPSLALQTPAQVRGQNIDATHGINAINANAFASRKASQMYGQQSLQNNQLIDSQANKMATEYASKIAQANQQNDTNVHNTNAQMSNQALNTNNQSRAQFIDKVNELRQNVTDTRNAIGATNLNLLGEGMNQQDNFNMSVDFMKKYQPWNVQNKMGQKDISKIIEDYNNIVKNNPQMSEAMQWQLGRMMFAPIRKQSPDMSLMQSLMNSRY